MLRSIVGAVLIALVPITTRGQTKSQTKPPPTVAPQGTLSKSQTLLRLTAIHDAIGDARRQMMSAHPTSSISTTITQNCAKGGAERAVFKVVQSATGATTTTDLTFSACATASMRLDGMVTTTNQTIGDISNPSEFVLTINGSIAYQSDTASTGINVGYNNYRVDVTISRGTTATPTCVTTNVSGSIVAGGATYTPTPGSVINAFGLPSSQWCSP